MQYKLSDLEKPPSNKIVVIYKDATVGEVQTDDPNIVSITPHDTLARSLSVSPEDWEKLKKNIEFVRLFQIVFRGSLNLTWEYSLQNSGSGVRHVVGMLLLLNEVQKLGKRSLLRYPETYLHPLIHGGIADLIIDISNRPICDFKTDEQLVDEEIKRVTYKK